MSNSRKDKKIVKAITVLRPVEQVGGSSDLLNIHSRLMKGRTSFESVFTGSMASAMNISNLDLQVSDSIEELKKISKDLSDTASELGNISQETANITEGVANTHETLSVSITEIAAETMDSLQEIEKSEENIINIENISKDAEIASKRMQEDMSDLVNVIEKMQDVIFSINAISGQTNLLALNASIEAARAGESGVGFAVVAEEIRKLAEETKKLTSNMDEFISSIQGASAKSVESVNTTVDALNQINQNLTVIVEGNTENRKRLESINQNLTNIAATSEEISGSMNEVEGHTHRLDERVHNMNVDAEHLRDVSIHLDDVVKPMVEIGTKLSDTNKVAGEMALDPFYMPSNKVFIGAVKDALAAHQNWLVNLDNMINEGKVQPLQTNHHLCAFGHFYYSVHPQNAEILKIWKRLRDQHKQFHANGGQAIEQIKKGNMETAREYYLKAVSISKHLLQDFESMIQIANELDKKDIRIFE